MEKVTKPHDFEFLKMKAQTFKADLFGIIVNIIF